MNKRRWGALIIFFILVIVLVLNSQTWQQIFDSGDGWEVDIYEAGTGENLVIIEINGLIASSSGDLYPQTDIYNHEIFHDQLKTAFQDDSIAGIILSINSPGGNVTECDEIFQTINQLKDEQDKPLTIYMNDIAASGAYLISAAGDVIYANRNTFTGSIGVVLSSLNVHQLAEEWGVRDEVFKSGPYKDTLNPLKEVGDDEREIMQALIDESYEFLIDSILEGRDMERDELLQLADGRIYSGPQAKENGLIDEIGFLDDAIEETAESAGITDPNVIRYVNIAPSPIDILFSQLQFLPFNQADDFSKLAYRQQHNYNYPSLMYIWSW